MSRASTSTLLDYMSTTLWAMEHSMCQRMAEVISRHSDGIKLSAAEIEAAIGRAADTPSPKTVSYSVTDGIAVIPVQGVMAKFSSQVNNSSQAKGTSCEAISANLRSALNDPAVEGILLLIDSPGGAVDGTADCAALVAEVANRKLTVSYIPDKGASAAYWLASQTSRIFGGQTATIGSIGVYSTMVDSSRAAANEGVDVRLISSGGVKGAGAPGTRVSDDQVAQMRQVILDTSAVFESAVAAGRGLSPEAMEQVTGGKVFVGKSAQAAGLIDGVATMEQVMGAMRTSLNAVKDPAGTTPDPNTTPDTVDNPPITIPNARALAAGMPSELAAVSPVSTTNPHVPKDSPMPITPAKLAQLGQANKSLAADLLNMHAAEESAVLAFIDTKNKAAMEERVNALTGELTTANAKITSLAAEHDTALSAKDAKITELQGQLATAQAAHDKVLNIVPRNQDPGALDKPPAGPAPKNADGSAMSKEDAMFFAEFHALDADQSEAFAEGFPAYRAYRKGGNPKLGKG